MGHFVKCDQCSKVIIGNHYTLRRQRPNGGSYSAATDEDFCDEVCAVRYLWRLVPADTEIAPAGSGSPR